MELSRKTVMISTKPRRPPPGGLLALIFAGYVPLASQNPYPIIVFSVANIVDPILVTLGEICNFCDPKLVTFYLCIYLILLCTCRHSGTFVNRKYEELSYLKNQKTCDPILVTLLKMRPHYSHTSHNAICMIIVK